MICTFGRLIITRRVPVEGKSSVCLICMKYRIIILIIIIISLGQILLSYIANTSRTHACQRTRAHASASTHKDTPPSPPPYRSALFIGAHPWWPAPLAFTARRWVIEINNTRYPPDFPKNLSFSRIKKLLGRTETRTRARMYLGRIRSFRDISRDDRARTATCSLRTPTDRQTDRLMENYSIDTLAGSSLLCVNPILSGHCH